MLGEIRLKADDGTDTDAVLRQPKRLAVLGFLACPAPGTRHRRDLLLALFWPELDTAHARTSLRNALYVLRQTLGDDVIRSTGDEEVSVNPDLVRTDVAVVNSALREGRIDDALAAYGGELLPGLFPADSEGFHRWLDSERTKLKVAISSAAAGRLNELEGKKEFQHALATARRMLEIEPDDETIVRRAMALHETLGDKAGGLNVFEKYRARLAADFDASPSPETIALADRLRSSPQPRAPRPKPSAVPESRPSESTLSSAEPGLQAPHVPDSPRKWAFPLVAVAVVAVVLIGGWMRTRPAMPMSIGASLPLTTEEGLQVEPAISPNGNLVAYAAGNQARLKIFIRTVGGGPALPLTNDTISHEVLPRWSPENDQVLFLSQNNAYVASIGNTPRLVARGKDVNGAVHSAFWSPEGDSIGFVRNDSLLSQPLDGVGTRFIGQGELLHSCTWSPNRKWIACVSGNWIEFEPGPLFGNDAPTKIVLFPAAGGKPIELTDGDHQQRCPTWSPDGKFLWLLSNRDGEPGEVYATPIGSDGHVKGSVTRVGVRAEWIGLSQNRIAYSVPQGKENILSVPIPKTGIKTLADTLQVTSNNEVAETVDISRDGQWLVYDSNGKGGADIYRKNLGTNQTDRLTDDTRPEYSASLSPGDSLLAWHRWIGAARRLFVKNLETGVETEILPNEPGDQGTPRWSPDSRSIAFWSHRTTEAAILVTHRNSAGGWNKPAWRLENGQLPIWSLDGRSIAFVKFDGSIEMIPADSGALRTVYSPRPGADDPIAIFLAWSSSPDTLWFLARDRKGFGSIWSLSVTTGDKKLLVRIDDPKKLIGLTMTTDQKRFFFTLKERSSNIRWAQLIKK